MQKSNKIILWICIFLGFLNAIPEFKFHPISFFGYWVGFSAGLFLIIFLAAKAIKGVYRLWKGKQKD